MATARLRWKLLRDLDSWLAVPMLLLGLAWLGIVIWELVSGSTQLLETVGTAIWAIFVAEFVLRYALAPEKGPFVRSNWLTIIALVVPALRLLRVLTVLRIGGALRGVRLVRVVGTANRSMKSLQATLERRGFGYVAALTLLVTALGAAGMLNFENASEVEGGLSSYGQALWWTGMLVATFGTDFWPATTEGRLLAFMLALYGLGVFGYIAASFASFFIGRDAEDRSAPIAGSRELAELRREIAALRRELAGRLDPAPAAGS